MMIAVAVVVVAVTRGAYVDGVGLLALQEAVLDLPLLAGLRQLSLAPLLAVLLPQLMPPPVLHFVSTRATLVIQPRTQF